MNRIKLIKTTSHYTFLFIIIFFIVYQYFYINQFSKFPWYHEFANDSDPSYAAQTLVILNGGTATYLHHPGVMVYSFDGFVFKIMGLVNTDYKKLTSISKISSESEGIDNLNIATQTGRKIALFTVIVLLILVYFLVFLLSSNALLAFLITLYLSLSKAVIQHSGIIRPEVFSLIFLLLAGLACLLYFKNKIQKSVRNELIVYILTGIFLCFALFSKIQIALYILVLFIIIFILLLSRFHSVFEENIGSRSYFAAGFGVLNIIITPWWALVKPSFLTPDYLKSISGNDFGRIYGPAPESMVMIVLAVLLVLLLISFLLFELQDYSRPRFRIYITAITFINAFFTGIILAVYLIFVPVFHDFTSYIENTHHIIYSMFTNVFYAGFLENPHFFTFETLRNIFTLHTQNSIFLFFNPLYIIALITVIILSKFLVKKQNKKHEYLLALSFLLAAFLMDYFSTMRWTTLYDHYAVYSLPVYFTGIAFFITTEFGNRDEFIKFGLVKRALYIAIITILVLNGCIQSIQLLNTKKVDINIIDMPERQTAISRTIVKPYWDIIDSVAFAQQNLTGTPRMKSNDSPKPFKALFSSQYDAVKWAAFKAFDKQKDYYGWHSQEGSTGYIGIDLGEKNSRTFTKYSLTSTISYMDYMPKDFVLEASNDENIWTNLDDQLNQTNWKSLETRTFIFTNNASYRYYRVSIKSNNGAAHILISEINFE
jgi:hypothetical protein